MILEIPIHIIYDSLKELKFNEDEYYTQGIRDFDNLLPVKIITDYINENIKLKLECGSFRILKYISEESGNTFINFDSEAYDWDISVEKAMETEEYFVYFKHLDVIYYVECYCRLKDYTLRSHSFSVKTLTGEELYTMHCPFEFQGKSEGYSSIECLRKLKASFEKDKGK